MNKNTLKKTFISTALMLMAGPTMASPGAAGSITYAPANITGLSTLSTPMLLLMATLMAVIAVRLLKNTKRQRQFLSITLVFSAVLLVSGNISVITDAWAAPEQLDNPAGGEVVARSLQQNTYQNATGALLQITDVVIPGLCENYPENIGNSDPACLVGSTLVPEAICHVDCSNPAR